MILRRSLLAATSGLALSGAAATTAQAALALPRGGKLGFRILRNGSEVGLHQLTFESEGGVLNVRIEIDIRVGLGPMTLYRYHHRGLESWQGGEFLRMDSTTDDDGDAEHMHAERRGGRVYVEGSKTEPYFAPPGALCSTYWNRAVLQQKIISSQDGRLFSEQITDLGRDAVSMSGGDAEMMASHFQLRGDLSLDIWYDDADQWAHLTFTKRSSNIVYVKL